MALITVSLTGLSADELTAIKKAYADEAGKAYGDVTESDIQDVVTTNVKQKIKCCYVCEETCTASSTIKSDWETDHPNFQ